MAKIYDNSGIFVFYAKLYLLGSLALWRCKGRLGLRRLARGTPGASWRRCTEGQMPSRSLNLNLKVLSLFFCLVFWECSLRKKKY